MIENELKAQAYILQEEYDIPIIIVRDTRSDAGMGSVIDTVFEKINNADIFLCDISPVTELNVKDFTGAERSKLMPNSNVMLELGYALRSMYYKRIIAVSNQTKFIHRRGNLPFDILNMRYVPFTSKKNLNLGNELRKSINFILDEGRRGAKESNWWSKLKRFSFRRLLKSKKNKEDNRISALMEKPEDFFSNRLSKAFPGVEGEKEYHYKEAISRLELLFGYPMTTASPLVIEENGKSYPIHLFRRINEYEVLIGIYQLYVKSIKVVRDAFNPSKQLIEIVDGEHDPIELDDTIMDNEMTDYSNDIQEYAVYTDGAKNEHLITKQHYVDKTMIDREGKPISLEGKSELRRVHLNGCKVYIVANTETVPSDIQSNKPLGGILDDYCSSKTYYNYGNSDRSDRSTERVL